MNAAGNAEERRISDRDRLCGLVVRIAMAKASELSDTLQGLLGKWGASTSGAYTHRTLLTVFACMNWMFAIGAWSSLGDTQLRRELRMDSKRRMVIATADCLYPDSSLEDLAFVSADLDLDEFEPFAELCLNRAKELDLIAIPFDADLVTLVALELIQERLRIQDDVMSLVIPCFLSHVSDAASSIEQIAAQVSRV